MELLRTGDMQGLDALIAERPGAVRHVLGRLWDTDPVIRERAVVVVGNAATHHQELGLELLRRFAWALNDESATNGLFVIPAIAAIATQVPQLARPFVGQLVEALNDPGLSEEATRALELIQRRRPELLEPYIVEVGREREQGCREGMRDRNPLPEKAN